LLKRNLFEAAGSWLISNEIENRRQRSQVVAFRNQGIANQVLCSANLTDINLNR
jgi:hypothetical protein